MGHIIPVLDIKKGHVVQALRGERECYAPIESVLTRHTQPDLVLEDLLGFAAFSTIYLADLDAIMREASQHSLILELCQKYPDIEFWVDAGPELSESQTCPPNYRPVIGTEFTQTWAPLRTHSILSLDFDSQGLRGGDFLWNTPDRWPEGIIVMCLHRVGSAEGPDMELLSRVRQCRPERKFFIGGGIRHIQDVDFVLQHDCGVLVASALHSGAITATEISARL